MYLCFSFSSLVTLVYSTPTVGRVVYFCSISSTPNYILFDFIGDNTDSFQKYQSVGIGSNYVKCAVSACQVTCTSTPMLRGDPALKPNAKR